MNLQDLLEVRGVRHALLVSGSGEVVQRAGETLDAAAEASELTSLRSGQAVVQSLGQQIGSEEWADLLLDLEGGPVLLTPCAQGTLLVGLDDVSSLGRARLGLKRLLGSAG
ncbi:roadblock/LC7 domain-containing protein [Deinococcus lacus]|uniref:Roadblock/LC7 domain-containing protein n=1 Tax=Deinococcus lacus TaxID=392561 RepID=A0ABW1YDZ6_9DEIO